MIALLAPALAALVSNFVNLDPSIPLVLAPADTLQGNGTGTRLHRLVSVTGSHLSSLR